MWNKKSREDIKKSWKERKLSIIYWAFNLLVACFVCFCKNGIINLLQIQINKFNVMPFKEVIFWLTICFFIFVFTIGCLTILIENFVKMIFKRDKEFIPFNNNFSLPITENLPDMEDRFFKRIIKLNKSKKIATAIVLKDFIKERDQSICNNKFKFYIPNNRLIIEKPDESLKCLIYTLSLLKKHEKNKYYNTELIISIGTEL